MIPRRAWRAALRPILAAAFVAAVLPAPAAGVSPSVTVTTDASPFQVTVGRPIAYDVTITNGSNSALKYARVTGQPSIALQYLGSTGPGCSSTTPTCVLDGLPSGSAATVTFYFLAPATSQSFTFVAFANYDGQTTNAPANYQNTSATPITTVVLAESQNLVRGHSFGSFKTFTTGLGSLSAANRHGTTVSLTTVTEVTVEDVSAQAANAFANCTQLLGAACFGEASRLDINDGLPVAGGLTVTVRWDVSDLPKGMTERKIRIAHLLDGGLVAHPVTALCNSGATNAPCLVGNPVRLADKDIQATLVLPSNGLVRGW
jgi:hypothetical protein